MATSNSTPIYTNLTDVTCGTESAKIGNPPDSADPGWFRKDPVWGMERTRSRGRGALRRLWAIGEAVSGTAAGYTPARGFPSVGGASLSSGLVTVRIVVLATRV
jgi:hypothetical protein